MFTRELEVGAAVLEVDQILEGDTGVVVWDAALVLAKYLGTFYLYHLFTSYLISNYYVFIIYLNAIDCCFYFSRVL